MAVGRPGARAAGRPVPTRRQRASHAPRWPNPVKRVGMGCPMTTPAPHITPRAPPRRVLEDASGRRLRRMRWAGRAVALFFLMWLAIVILGGLGVGPATHLPFGKVLRPSTGPPPLPHTLRPRKAAPADLVPALPAAASSATHGRSHTTPAPTTTGKTHGRSGSAPGHTKTPATTSPGRSGSAPGHTKTTTTATTTRGRSATAPGKTKTGATTTNRAGQSHVTGKKP